MKQGHSKMLTTMLNELVAAHEAVERASKERDEASVELSRLGDRKANLRSAVQHYAAANGLTLPRIPALSSGY